MFFDVAGGRPGGEFGRIVFVDVGHDGFEDVQGNRGLVRGVFQSAGRPGLCAHARAFGSNRGFKGGDVRAELREKGGGQSEADELRGERRRVGLKGAGGIEQGLVAAAAGHEKFSIESRRAKQREGVRGGGDAEQIVMEVESSGDFCDDAAVRGVMAGDLCATERGGLRDGGVDEGELLSAHAGGQKVCGVGNAKGVHGFEGCGEAGDLVVHTIIPFPFLVMFPFPNKRRLEGDYPPIEDWCNNLFQGNGRNCRFLTTCNCKKA